MIRFYKPTLKRKDMDSVLQTMVDEKIGPGEKVLSFMQAYSETVNAISSSSYRTYPDCLASSLLMAGAGTGVKVAVSPLSPQIYKAVIEDLGAEIVYVDIDKENGCPREDLVASCGASILLLYENYGTIPMKYNEKTTYAELLDYGSVKVIEDISESIGGHLKDEGYAGAVGQLVVCAFEEDSVVSSGGGCAVGAKSELVSALRGRRPSKYIKMPDLNAALGLVQLSNLEANSAKRREIVKLYQQALSKTRHKQFGLSLIDFESNCSGFAVLLDSKPDEAIKFGAKHDVPIKMAFDDCLIKTYDGDPFEAFPVAASYYYRAVSFPVYPFLKGTEVDLISKIISHLP